MRNRTDMNDDQQLTGATEVVEFRIWKVGISIRGKGALAWLVGFELLVGWAVFFAVSELLRREYLPLSDWGRSYDGFWGIASIGLAGFSLGLGAAYLAFARYRNRLADRLEQDFADLQSRADFLAARIVGAEGKRPRGI